MGQVTVEYRRIGVQDSHVAPRMAAEPPRVTSSGALLAGARKLMIDHEGEVYTLHLTRQNKLLLTK